MRRLLPIGLCLALAGCASGLAGAPSTSAGASRRQTDRNLDLAIDGDGFFIVQTPAGGFLFTRSGELTVSATGELVNGDGYKLYPIVSVPEGSSGLKISTDGVVRRDVPGGDAKLAGQIVLSRFAKPGALERDGIYFLPTPASGDPITGKPSTKGLGTILIGQLEE